MRNLFMNFSNIILVVLLFMHSLKAQDTQKKLSDKLNIVHAYVGLIEYNVNYERNIFLRPKSSSNLRLGVGHGMFLVAGEGYYMNGAFVHLFGAKNSHFEINAGVKYMLTNSISDPPFSDQLLPDIFLGYRFQKPTGGLIFRAGINYLTLLNIGIGYAF
ncbi:hypothetical protein GXP67_22880 [Rhodocytophaga rosea]|uniref:DUF3575 domain-containing protein n=1 Tax=Rhodocytophaga rosea TaxID=2704465 RepID=A0A6C0GMW2_9BACT|nr:hypothetical protein [Rhodocytophaga rosea]QHT69277.1 hypothetical protein GXP67_22880 [Rhodocytophaga rosea]